MIAIVHLSQLWNVFLQTAKYIWYHTPWHIVKIEHEGYHMIAIAHLSQLWNVFVQSANYICPNCEMYLYKLPTIFIIIYPANWKDWKWRISHDSNCAFVPIVKCICPKWQLYLSLYHSPDRLERLRMKNIIW